MTNRKLYSKVGWRKYLDPTNKPRVQKFIKMNGKVIFKSIVENIEQAGNDNVEELMILVHPNVSSVVVVNETEYDDVLNHCIKYFESVEEYEECKNILKIKNKISNRCIK